MTDSFFQKYLDAFNFDFRQCVNQFFGMVYPAGSPISHYHVIIHCGKITPEGYVSRLYVHTYAYRFKYSATGVILFRIIAKEGEMSDVTTRADAAVHSMDKTN